VASWKNRWTFGEILVQRKGRGHAGGGYYEKRLEKIGPKPFSLGQFYLLQHNALRFMITQFRAGKLHSCLYYSSDRPTLSYIWFASHPSASFLMLMSIKQSNKSDTFS